jgi:hypothetical protein
MFHFISNVPPEPPSPSFDLGQTPTLAIKAHFGCVVRAACLAPDGVYTCAFDKRIVFWDFALRRGELGTARDVLGEAEARHG